MKIDIAHRPAFSFVGIHVSAPFSELGVKVPAARKALLLRLPELGTLPAPKVVLTLTPVANILEAPERYECHVGVEVEAGVAAPSGMVHLQIPAQDCAHVAYRGPMDQCWRAYFDIIRWAKEEGHTLDASSSDQEVHGERHDWEDKQREDNELDIFVPILPPRGQG